MPEVDQKFFESLSLFISTVVPILSKKAFTFLFGGQIGTGPIFSDIGGKGIALTIVDLTLIILFNSRILIVEIKLTIVWLYLNFKSFIIFLPTIGVTDKKTQSHSSTIFWLFFSIEIFLKLFFKFRDTILFLEDIIIFLYLIDDLEIPVTTDDVIFPVPIKPIFISSKDCSLSDFSIYKKK